MNFILEILNSYMDVISVLTISVLMIIIVLVPGIALSMAIFPRREELDMVERVGISFVLGLTPQFVLYFADKNSIMPINEYTNLLMIILITIIGIAVWNLRRENE